MSVRGKFIVIEGLEGAGKSSAMQVVKTLLEERGIQYETTREPGGTPMSEAIRECVKHDWQEDVNEKTELLLMYAARVQLVSTVIQPALDAGKWVLGDRHDMSSQAYQGGGRGISTDFLKQLKMITLGDFTPDLTLYLDIEPQQGLARARGRGELDRIEKASQEFFEKTRKRYLELVENDRRCLSFDASQDMQVLHQQIRDELIKHV